MIKVFLICIYIDYSKHSSTWIINSKLQTNELKSIFWELFLPSVTDSPFVWRVQGIELSGWVLFHRESVNAADNLVQRFRRIWIFGSLPPLEQIWKTSSWASMRPFLLRVQWAAELCTIRIYCRNKSILDYKCLNNLVPQYLCDYFSRNHSFHSYNTRRREDIHPSRPKLILDKRTFRYSGAILFSYLKHTNEQRPWRLLTDYWWNTILHSFYIISVRLSYILSFYLVRF